MERGLQTRKASDILQGHQYYYIVCVDTRGSVKQTAQFICRLNDCVWCWCVSELHHQHTQEMSRGTQIISTMNTKT